MNIIRRKPPSLGRAARENRDDRVFVVAAEDTYAPKQYFKHLPMRRVRVMVLPTPVSSGLSSPGHVVDRLKEAFLEAKKNREVQSGDEFWVCLDMDHHMADTHLKGTLLALAQARQAGFELAISNPCFELWLLLHHEDVAPGTVYTNGEAVERALKARLGGYNKICIHEGMFPLATVPDAIRRARLLETSPDDPVGPWPDSTGTRMYRLLERALQGRR